VMDRRRHGEGRSGVEKGNDRLRDEYEIRSMSANLQ
jgi:hypothetical protein